VLSQRQFDILKYIHRYSAENGFAPSIREISLTTAITSTSVVNYNLERLITLGYLVKSRGKSRALVLTGRALVLFEPNQSVDRVSEKYIVDDMPDSNPSNGDISHLHKENLRLKAENERLRRESKNRVAALQREIQYLSQELRQVQQSSERFPA
jgi:SOS-response transcriptional repressor LexA